MPEHGSCPLSPEGVVLDDARYWQVEVGIDIERIHLQQVVSDVQEGAVADELVVLDIEVQLQIVIVVGAEHRQVGAFEATVGDLQSPGPLDVDLQPSSLVNGNLAIDDRDVGTARADPHPASVEHAVTYRYVLAIGRAPGL